MGDDELAEKEATARKAIECAPGRWKLWGTDVMADLDGTGNVRTAKTVAETCYCDGEGCPRTFIAEHIAAFDPTTALDLCAAVRERDTLIDTLRAGIVSAMMSLEGFDHAKAAEVLRRAILATVPS